ncbi:MAG: hypothetical protein GY773_06630, partial [Actinomycetia bacterium]|nr:hypothetical protein [Actinomycetes bacterium]
MNYWSDVYKRSQHQPRLISYQEGLHYKDRHHHLYAGDNLLTTSQLGGSGYVHRLLEGVSFINRRGFSRTPKRKVQALDHRMGQVVTEGEARPDLPRLGHEPLRVLQSGSHDPGNVACRLHTAINTCSPHESALACRVDRFGQPVQLDLSMRFDRLVGTML